MIIPKKVETIGMSNSEPHLRRLVTEEVALLPAHGEQHTYYIRGQPGPTRAWQFV